MYFITKITNADMFGTLVNSNSCYQTRTATGVIVHSAGCY